MAHGIRCIFNSWIVSEECDWIDEYTKRTAVRIHSTDAMYCCMGYIVNYDVESVIEEMTMWCKSYYSCRCSGAANFGR